MIEKIVVLGLVPVCATVTVSAEEPSDSIMGTELNEVVVTGNSARQRISNPRLELNGLNCQR